ncbi:MAG: hypothetical protein FJ184_03805 [Gammaproteobacteria bacterium]|nr:hypothetical protein [Gammaproteobacteria bacterium]
MSGKSFAFLQTTGNRDAPETLILELFREIFFDPVSSKVGAQPLSPDFPDFSRGERAVLNLARGRLKKNRNSVGDGFFAPVYPEQARGGWLRQKSDRAIRHHFIEGALAHGLQHLNDQEREEQAALIVRALMGSNRPTNHSDVRSRELLAAAVADTSFEPGKWQMRNESEAAVHLATSFQAKNDPALSLGKGDPLAELIANDFSRLCEMEQHLPRLLWLEWLKSFLRLAVPIWVLSRMRIAVMLRDWSVSAMEGAGFPSEDAIKKAIQTRWQGIFHPTSTGTTEIAQHISKFMRARIELSILIYLLRESVGEKLFDKSLSISSPGADRITVYELLQSFSVMPRAKGRAGNNEGIRIDLVRAAESFPAWANPLNVGTGKNIDEFLRALRRFQPVEEDRGYLAEAIPRTDPPQSVVFPGPAMIRLVLALCYLRKAGQPDELRGKLVLSDLEQHFQRYGLEFSASAGARPRLISELSRLGLLKGSPDAGEYAELVVPVFASERIPSGDRFVARGARK